MDWSINPQYKPLDDHLKPYHDLKTTKATIKELLKDGTPDWIRFPNEYKQFAKEMYLADKETSDEMVEGYKMADQDILTNYKARAVNIMSTRDFITKLRTNGIKCFTLYNGMPQTVGLWAIVPTRTGINVRYVCYLQIPAMIEWSVLDVDAHGLPAGESYRGWRTVLSEMIKKKVISEEKAHEIFGRPTDSIVSRRYRKTLWAYRHRNKDIEIRDGF
jgi:hypothetical protein